MNAFSPTNNNLKHKTRLYNCNDKKNYKTFGIVENSPGVCGSLACAVCTAYYDDYKNIDLCSDKDKNSGAKKKRTYGINLVNKIVQYVEPKKGDALVLGGFNIYMIEKKKPFRIYIQGKNITANAKYNSIRKEIKADRPCVIGVTKSAWASLNGGHWCVAIGTKEDGRVRVNSGHGDEKSINRKTIVSVWDCHKL